MKILYKQQKCYTNVLFTASLFKGPLERADRLSRNSSSGYYLEMLYRNAVCVFVLKQENPEEHVTYLFL